MPITEADIVGLLQAIQHQLDMQNRSWVRLEDVANGKKGPDEVGELREYMRPEGICEYLREKVGLTPVGRKAARDGRLKNNLKRQSQEKQQARKDHAQSTAPVNPFSESWLTTSTPPPVDTVVISGNVPFRRDSIRKYLTDRFGATVRNIDEDYEDPDLLVVGQTNHSKGAIPSFLANQRGTPLRICSQEMLLSWMYTGQDPNQNQESVHQFIEVHPTLKRIRELLDGKWPETGPIPPVRGDSVSSFDMEVEESPLKRLGYETGSTGKDTDERRDILRKAFNCPLSSFPGTYPAHYLDDWGRADSGVRLERIAQHVAYHCRLFKRQENPPMQAIDEREADLEWLRSELFPPLNYTFDWPDT